MSSAVQKAAGRYLKQAETLQRRGQHEEATIIYQKYVEELRKVHQTAQRKKNRGEGSADPREDVLDDLLTGLILLAKCCRAANKPERAVGPLEECLSLLESELDEKPDSRDVTKTNRRCAHVHRLCNLLGLCMQSLGRSTDALAALVRGLEFAKKAEDRLWTAKGLETVGLFHLRVMHCSPSALQYFQELLLEAQRAEGEGHPDQWRTQRRAFGLIGDALEASGEAEKAIKYHAMSLDLAREKGILGEVGNGEVQDGEIGSAMEARENLALASLHRHKYDDAVEQAKELLLLAQRVGDKTKHQLSYELLSDIYQAAENTAKAQKYRLMALDIGIHRAPSAAFPMLAISEEGTEGDDD
mmetsp:Transcript_44352/g.115261  ORF Transcript_44352/g.115261 Transcript_44352/m.115261 type:complete len:357 (-) Transcript_44352:431-1501(-)